MRSPADVQALHAKMAAGDEVAFARFGEEYGPRFRAYYIRKGLGAADAEELAVTTVTEVALSVDKFEDRGSGSFDRWAFTIAHRVLADWRRAEDRQARAMEAVAAEAQPQTDDATPRELLNAVNTAIAQLRSIDRGIISMRMLAAPYSFPEIAKRFNISPNAARVRYHRALQRLGAILHDERVIKARLERGREGTR